jgi:hypothetical protein
MKSNGKPISRKVLAQLLTSLGVYLVALALGRLGVNLDPATAGLVAAGVAAVAGFAAGWLTRELPGLVVDDTRGVDETIG